jgi:hypothetical protein
MLRRNGNNNIYYVMLRGNGNNNMSHPDFQTVSLPQVFLTLKGIR